MDTHPAFNSYYEKLADGTVRCIDSEIPFEIPDSWAWARIRDISKSYIGLTYRPTDVCSDGTIVLRSSNIQDGKLRLSDIVRVNTPISDKLWVEENDIIICARNGSKKLVGKSAIVDELKEPMTFGAFMAICKTQFYKFVFLYLQSECFFGQLRDVSGTTTINQLTQNNFNNFLIPLPPIEEQKRIIEKANSLLPIIGTYGSAQEALDSLNYIVNGNLKKSILQEAIQGRLVSQIASEGTAEELLAEIAEEKKRLFKEGKLKKSALTASRIFRGDDNKYRQNIDGEEVIIDDRLPFEIPATWRWVELEQICEYIQRGKSPKYSLIKQIPVVAQKCNQWSGFQIEKAQFIEPESLKSYGSERLLQDGDLMWNSTGLGTLGRMAIYWENLNPYGIAVADSHVTVIRVVKGLISPEYLYMYFSSNTVQSVIEDKADGSTKQKELATATVKSYPIPLPPYKEQLRIVAQYKALASIMSR